MFAQYPASELHRIVFAIGFGATLLIVSAPSVEAQGDPDKPVITGRVATPPQTAAVDMYIKLPDIDGESVDENHDKWIDVLSIDWGAHKPTAGENAARRRGDVILEDVTMTKEYDASSPKIMLACANGTHFPSVELEAPERPGAKATYMKYELKNVMITSYSIDATGERPMETIKMTYQKVDATEIDESSRVKVKQNWDRDE
jgi:type VI secretion system secreted protein Hcp